MTASPPLETASPPQEAWGPMAPSLWWNVLGVAVSVGLVAAILFQLDSAAADGMKMIVQLPIAVWPAMVLLYLTQPICDFAVYRRTWNLPLSGFGVLLRKNVINEIVLGYSGQAYLYVWARRASGADVAPFAAIKDASIISALLGNLLTLVLTAISVTQLTELGLVKQLGPALWSGLIPIAISIGLVAFGRWVFSLSPRLLLFVTSAHTLRIIVSTALTVMIWRMALPEVEAQLWLVLMAVRYLVSRIPLLANKDLVFGNLMVFLLGPQAPVAVLLAALALATLLMHLGVIVILGAVALARHLAKRITRSAPSAGIP
ncbi:hypothetical protein EIB18_04045 [Caulobacter vibrioides]|nr:hypothetical protein CA608_03845 [Caulobacter vibrioides]AZH11963.1 hypothetical protein EIB18_04045 [Caulobacter vibrioides]PLR15460.1 hypothetical protein CVUC_02990 [Caulobacter vibrioides]